MDDVGPILQMDHVVPLSLYDIENEDELFKACNWTNIQLLTATENKSKRSKLDIEMYENHKLKVIYFIEHYL